MPWIPSQTKMRSKLGIQRIRQLIEKNESLAKRSRREVASLLEQGKVETARIRTESLILSDQHTELLELLELYLELILARFGLLEINNKEKEPDEGVREAVCAVVYAAPRCEIRELHIIREAFMSRYGREWAVGVMENSQGQVSSRVLNKCKTSTPDKAYVDLYLVEISKAYGLSWRPADWVDLAEEPGAGSASEDTAAQEQRVMEAELQGAGGPRRGKGTDEDDDAAGGGDYSLPSVPSGDPKLNDIRSSTSTIPIIRSNAAASTNLAPESGDAAAFDLPTTPPFDPAQSSRTVVIKSMSPQTSKGTGLPLAPTSAPASNGSPSKPPVNATGGDSKFDDLAKRFEALKRK